MSEKTSATKSTEAGRKVRAIVKDIYAKAHQARANGEPIISSMIDTECGEILFAMGIVPVWRDQFASLCAVKRRAEPFILCAEAEGYSNTLCGYVRVGIGFDQQCHVTGAIPEDSPDGGMPQPDLILGTTVGCDPRFKWCHAATRYADVPTFVTDVMIPPVHCDLGAVEPDYVAYQLEQLRGLVAFLEHHTKRKLDIDKLDFAFERSQQVWQRWYECDMLRKAVPGPMPAEDAFNVFVPALLRCFDDATLAFYHDLHVELSERVSKKVGVIENERYRLLWANGVPPWHSMRVLNYFEERGAVLVMDRVYRLYDPVAMPATIGHPLEKIAYRTFKRLTQRHELAKRGCGHPDAEHVRQLIRDFNIDGVVAHVTKSCRAWSLGQLYLKEVIRRSTNIPFLQLQSDLIDVRDFSEEQWRSSIDAFIETIANAKR